MEGHSCIPSAITFSSDGRHLIGMGLKKVSFASITALVFKLLRMFAKGELYAPPPANGGLTLKDVFQLPTLPSDPYRPSPGSREQPHDVHERDWVGT